MTYHGILPINKPKGMTSHDVVFKARKLLKMKKIGHTGTLDPDVEGVLVLCLGKATKLVNYLMESPKAYQGGIFLGQATETEDASGAVIASQPVLNPLTDAQVDQAMAAMTGEIQQIPPYYSAVKVKGKRLYEYARAGQRVERPVRQAQIYDFQRQGATLYDPQDQSQSWNFQVTCSKGTYVRTLAVDLGKSLGYPAHMTWLQRTMTAGFSLDQTYSLAWLDQASPSQIEAAIYSLDHVKKILPWLALKPDQVFSIQHGQVVDQDFFDQDLSQATALYYQNQLLAIYGPHPDKAGRLKPFAMFPDL